MLEIDGVRHAIESIKPYEWSDELSDGYWRLIDLATRSALERRHEDEILDLRGRLMGANWSISQALERSGNGNDLLTAYNGVLQQVDNLMSATSGRM